MRNVLGILGWACAACLLAFDSADAGKLQLGPTAVPIVNPSFEDDVIVVSGAFTSSVNGWVTSPNGGKGTFRPSLASYPAGPPEGVNVAYINLAPNPLVQTLAETLEEGMVYRLFVEVGKRQDADFAGSVITLEANGQVLATGTSPTPPNGGFVTSETVYTVQEPDIGQPLTIRLNSVLSSGVVQVNFDDVRLFKASADPSAIFADGFEAGNTSSWSATAQGTAATVAPVPRRGARD